MQAPTDTALPNLIVIGSAKSGTTSLHSYLDAHPEISMAMPQGVERSRDNDTDGKEMRFFWRDDWLDRMDWYQSHFATMNTAVRGEVTPAYSAYPFHAEVAGRIHSVAPEASILYIVRDPIDRIIAHFVQRQADGDRRPFDDYMREYDTPDNPIVCPSKYAMQLELYLRFFDPSQLLVLDQNELKHRRRAVLRRVFSFLRVDPAFWSPVFENERNTGAHKYALTPLGGNVFNGLLDPAGRRLAPRWWPGMRSGVRRMLSTRITDRPAVDEGLREKLTTVLQPEVDRLRSMTGERFESWSM
ncbi:MAG TPA: sulfotransferase [Solirubrobacterales bacterium]